MALFNRLFSSKKNQKETLINLDKDKSSSAEFSSATWLVNRSFVSLNLFTFFGLFIILNFSIHSREFKSQNWKPFNFNKDQVRVLLFRECEWRGRKLLFDSKAVNKISFDVQSCKSKRGCKMKSDTNSKLENYVEITDGCGYQYMKPSSDTLQLGEMVFGSVAMSFQGSTLKVHQLKSPTRVMCTKVFSTISRYPYNGNLNERSLEDSFSSSIHSMNEYLSSTSSISNSKHGTWSLKGSGPVDVPLCNFQGKSNGGSLELDSGICGNASLQSSGSASSENNFNCGSALTYPTYAYSRQNYGSLTSHASGCSDGSFGGLQRRWSHTINMSLEHCTNSSSCSENVSNSYKHNTKLGLAILVTFVGEDETDMEIFFFEHMILVENIVERLRCSVEQAYFHKNMFVHLMVDGSEKMKQWLEDLFCAPRLINPLWLRLTSSPKAETSALVLSFIEDLCYLVANMDTKDTNFFISTLLTAVLTHHLGWVSTVLPEKMMPLNKCKGPCTSKLLKALALSHPYNPLWAQLGDLCGALGHPTKIARTIVTGMDGEKVDVLNKILTSLTYFIRCGEISKKTSSRCSRELEDRLLKTSLVQSFPSTINIKCGSLSTLVMDVSSETISDKKNGSHKLNQNCTPISCDLEQTFNMSISEEENYLNSNIDETTMQKYSICKNGMKLSSTNIRTKCSHLTDQVEKLECEHLPFYENSKGNHLSPTVMPGLQSRATDCKNSSQNLNVDKNLCKSDDKTKDSGITENLPINNFLHSFVCDLSNVKKTGNVPFLCGEVKYPNLFTSQSAELKNIEKNISCIKNSEKLVKNIEATCVSENSKPYTGALKRTSSVISNLSNTSSTTNINYLPLASNVVAHKEYVKIYPSLAELLMLERGSGLLIEETNSIEQDVSPDYLHGMKSHLSRNITSPAISAKSNITVQRKQTVSALSQFDMYIPKKIENERQVSSTVTVLDDIVTKSDCSDIVQKCSNTLDESGTDTGLDSNAIIFLIGDEKLIGLKKTINNAMEDSHTAVCGSKLDFSNQCVNISSVPSNVSFCESCRTRKVSNLHHCDYSCVTTKLAKNLLNENDSIVYTCKNFDNDCSPKTDGYNIVTVCSCVELENENNMWKKSSCLQSPQIAHLCRSTSTRSVNRHSKQCVKLCPSQSGLLRNCEQCKNSIYCTSNCSNVFKCTVCKSDENNRILQDFPKRVCVTTNKVCLKDDEVCCKDIDSCNCVNSQNTSGFEVTGCLSSHSNFTAEGNIVRCVKEFHKDDNQTSFVELPLLKSVAESSNHKFPLGLAFSLLGATGDHYMSDLVLQGCTQKTEEWQMSLRKDLSFVAHNMFLEQEVSEALCIIGNTDTWEVQLVSSHTYVVDKPGMFGVRVGMSQLVANMLESLLNLWKMHTPPEHCLLYLESKLREVCLRSQALAELLLKTDFCDMEKLTVTLDLEANDVPLLLAVASTHTPQVTQRYGLCFR